MDNQTDRALTEPLRLLILGGTTEASRLAARLAGDPTVRPTLSLAGRTRDPVLPAIPVRIGGFGGVAGLVRTLREASFGAVVDATHPFAAQISRHTAEACAILDLPLAVYTRAPWAPDAGDRWIEVGSLEAAVEAIGRSPRRVFLTTGRLGLAAFKAAPQHHYLGRTIDPPAPRDCPPSYQAILDRGPFSIEGEAALMRREAVQVLVTKNSGAAASRPKLLAARTLGLPVIMVQRPAPPSAPVLTSLAEVETWIAAHGGAP